MGLDVLVAVLALLDRVAHALGHPVALHARAGLQRGLRVGELLELLARVPAGHLPLDEIGVVAAVVHADQLLGEVELDHTGDGPREELAVVADQDDPGPRAGDEALELVEAGEVQVVGGLVEQQHVVAGQQQRGQPDPGRLPAGEPGRGGRRAHAGGRRRRRPPRRAPRSRPRRGRASVRGRRRSRRRRRPRRPASASVAASRAAWAAATPVRRASAASTDSPARRSCSCGR